MSKELFDGLSPDTGVNGILKNYANIVKICYCVLTTLFIIIK